jgi:hypothetical protein
MSEVKVIWHGQEVIFATRARAMKALERTGDFLLDKADETVPTDKGTLKGSGKVGIKTSGGEITSIKISYPDNPVALIQHEDTEYKHTPPERAKWLQLTLQEQREAALAMIAEDLRAWGGLT